MNKYLRSEKGGTLMLVFAFIIMLSIIVVPLAMNTNMGLLQAKTGGNSEKAFTQSQSALNVFDALYGQLKTKPDYTKDDIVSLVNKMKSIPELKLDKVDIVWSAEDEPAPVAVVFASKSGSGNQVRVSTLTYHLEPLPIIIPGVTPPPDEDKEPEPPNLGSEFYNTRLVVQKYQTTKDQFNQLFYSCAASIPPDIQFIDNAYDPEAFTREFNPYAEYYLEDLYQYRTEEKVAAVNAIENTIPAGTQPYNIDKSGQGIRHNGQVNILNPNDKKSDFIISQVSDGIAVQTRGNLAFSDVASTHPIFDGKVLVGGNITSTWTSRITFNDDLYVRGNMHIGYSSKEILVKGDLVVNGDLSFGNSIATFKVEGDLIVGGNIIFKNTVQDFFVGGSLMIDNYLLFSNSVQKVTIGKDLIAQGTVDFDNTGSDVLIGGSLVSKGDLNFHNSVNRFTIGNDIITTGNFTFQNTIGPMNVGGSIMVLEDMSFDNSLTSNANSFGGFFIGGYTNFPSYYVWEKNKICIK